MRATFFLFQHIRVYSILYLFLISLTNAHEWSSGRAGGCELLGPGFDSQVPLKLNIIFSIMFLCRPSNSIHHNPHISANHVSPNANPMATREGTSCSQVKADIGDSQSQQGLECSWARISKSNTQFWPIPPFGFAFFIFFLI